MKIAGFVPSVRPVLLQALLKSWRGHEAVWGIPLHIHAQRAPRHAWDALAAEFADLPLVWTHAEQGGPVFPIRCAAMRANPGVDTWIHFDDDMELVPGLTDFTEAIVKANEPGVGVVSCNWTRSMAPGLLARCWPPREPLWIKQPIVNMSGGMVYTRRVVDELLKVGNVPYLFDDTQVGLSAYLAGYENWRYRGSVLIHKILSPGGVKEVFKSTELVPPDAHYMRVRKCKPVYAHEGNNLYIPTSDDLTPEAHATHRAHRAFFGGT